MAAPPVVGYFFQDVFGEVNDALNSFVTQFSSNIIAEISGLVAAGLVLYFIMHGIAILRGYASEPILDTAMQMFRVSIIVAIALTAGTYQGLIVNSLINVPDTLMTSLMGNSVSGFDVKTGGNAAQAFDEMLYKGMTIASQYSDKAKVGVTGTNLMPYIYAIFIVLGTIFCILVGAFWFFASKIILTLLLGIGPIFIVALIWQPLQQYFFTWLSAILNTIVTCIFVLGIFSIFGSLFEAQLEALTPDDAASNQIAATAVIMFMGVLTCAVLLVIPTYVGQLTNAGSGGIFGAMKTIAMGAGSAVGKAANGVGNAGNVLSSNRKANSAYDKARGSGSSHQDARSQAKQAYQSSRNEYFRHRSYRR
jgi:type IV secretion system protein VirB6